MSEQGAILDGYDDAVSREQGTDFPLDAPGKLRLALQAMPAAWATWLNGARTDCFATESQRPP